MTEQVVIDYAFEFRTRVNQELHLRGWIDKDLANALGVGSARMLIKWTDFMHRPLYNYPKNKKEIST